ncbi:MAG TPA: phosphatase PAP2 family protein [Dehalococcoidales bacterium]|nr:phosphatase PAP2 family protein [Dehalococcoidales bacterium]
MDKSIFLFINGLAGRNAVMDGFFRGVSNDYFALVSCCFILVWLWFGLKNEKQRLVMQKTVLVAAISIGLTAALVGIVNHFYFRPRPFNVLPPDTVTLLFYKPTDSSFPSNLASILFAAAWPVFIKNKTWGSIMLAIDVLAGFGRVFIGVHYPLDILGGAGIAVVGTACAFGAMWLIGPLERFLVGLLRAIHLAQ